MAHAAIAAACPAFSFGFWKLDEKFRRVLENEHFTDALQWAATPRTPEASQELLLLLLRSPNASDEEIDKWLEQAEDLYALACDFAPSAHKRVGSIQSLELSADLEMHRRAGHLLKEKGDLRKLEVAALTDVPTAWRGKVYRRTESTDTAHKREEDEQKERARWAKELAGLLLETNLPFARNLGSSSLDGASLRCCRGLRARTLAQRVSCWRPFRRWLLATTRSPWHLNTAAVLAYFEVRRSEGAPRTAYASLLQPSAFSKRRER